jgi:hypothetical protein
VPQHAAALHGQQQHANQRLNKCVVGCCFTSAVPVPRPPAGFLGLCLLAKCTWCCVQLQHSQDKGRPASLFGGVPQRLRSASLLRGVGN